MEVTLLVQFFRALSEETRLRAVMLLLHGELCVCDLMVILEEPQSKISRHLAYLKHSGIVKNRRAGLWMHYSLKTPLEETFQGQLHLLREKLSSRPPFCSDIKKMLDLKAQGGCKAVVSSNSIAMPQPPFSRKRRRL